MFAAALLYSAPSVEISIYSTCKRISQKLLRNVMKFLALVHEGLGTPEFKEVRCNMEELVLQGPDGTSDIRTVNSYPSKVSQVHGLGRGRERLCRVEVLDGKCRFFESFAKVPGALKALSQVRLGLLVQCVNSFGAPQHVRRYALRNFSYQAIESRSRDGVRGLARTRAAGHLQVSVEKVIGCTTKNLNRLFLLP
jgi:hypothetical protein